MKQKKIYWIVSFFGVGGVSKAPGTMGTLAAVPIWMALERLDLIYYLVFVGAFILFSIFVCDKYELKKGAHDSSEVVIDEVAGFWVSMAGIPNHGVWVVLGFLLFRLFDIFKPGPIGYIDRNMKRGAGVVLDDVAAGLVVNIILHVIYNVAGGLRAGFNF